jgi:hypothetical protein
MNRMLRDIKSTEAATTLLAAVLVVILMRWAASAEPRQQPPDDHPADVAILWFHLLYDIVKSEQVSPPPAARAYGLTAITLYEAIVEGSLEHRSLVSQLNELASLPRPKRFLSYYWPSAANAALAQVTKGLFPAASEVSLEKITAFLRQSGRPTSLRHPFRSTAPAIQPSRGPSLRC